MPERERSRSGEGKGRRVGEETSRRWCSGRGIGGERRWQERRREGSGARQRKTKQRCQGDLFVISKEFRDPSVN
jgi:hypothetical protein